MKNNFKPVSKGRWAMTALGTLPLLYFYLENSSPANKSPCCYPGFSLNVTSSMESFLTTQLKVATQSLCFIALFCFNFLISTYYIFLNTYLIFVYFPPHLNISFMKTVSCLSSSNCILKIQEYMAPGGYSINICLISV